MTRPAQLQRVVTAEWVRARLGDANIALVDARPRDEHTGADGGHGGQLALRRRFEQAVATQGKQVVTYCFIGMRASVTYFTARLLGYDVSFYDGSWVDWSNRGMPVEAGEGPAAIAR